VTSHRAFGYLANRYGLVQLPIAGISPEEEPNPKSIEAVANLAKAKGVTVIFFESLVPKKLSETVANEIGATTSALDPIEGLTAEAAAAGSNYVSIQQDNLSALRAGLRCR
jgi:zinc transport system substrate-binding protein